MGAPALTSLSVQIAECMQLPQVAPKHPRACCTHHCVDGWVSWESLKKQRQNGNVGRPVCRQTCQPGTSLSCSVAAEDMLTATEFHAQSHLKPSCFASICTPEAFLWPVACTPPASHGFPGPGVLSAFITGAIPAALSALG